MDAIGASPSLDGRNSASDDLVDNVEYCGLICGLLVVIESDPGIFTTPPVLSVHEASSESLNSTILNPGHMVPPPYLVVLLLGDRSRQWRARGRRLQSHRPPHLLRMTAVVTLQYLRLVPVGELTACPASINGFPSPHHFPPLHRRTVAVSETCRGCGRGKIPKHALTLTLVRNRHVPSLSSNRGRMRYPRHPLEALPCTRALVWRFEGTYLDFALLPALAGDVVVTVTYYLLPSKR